MELLSIKGRLITAEAGIFASAGSCFTCKQIFIAAAEVFLADCSVPPAQRAVIKSGIKPLGYLFMHQLAAVEEVTFCHPEMKVLVALWWH